MLYFNTLFEANPAPVAYHVSPDKPMNFPSKPANNNTNANMSKPAGNSVSNNNNVNMNKMTSSNVQTNNKIDDSDRDIASLVKDTSYL